ncbi:MAG: YidB family protein [Hyphomicrobium sp.]|uniref:YidB family protein n=1 Tax=Hyphomicrobium sp. TaxID=82 RepID=UPI0039E275F5
MAGAAVGTARGEDHIARTGMADDHLSYCNRFSKQKGQTMTWSDALKGVVGNIVGQAEQGALPDLIKGVLGTEGLQTILAKLQGAGFGDQVQSWFDKNKNNLPITPDQIKTALGDEHVQQIARSLGIPVDDILAALAKVLPELANTAGPAANPSTPANTATTPDPKAS